MKSLSKAIKLSKLGGVSKMIIVFSLIPVVTAGLNIMLFDSLSNQMIGIMILEIMPMILHSSYGQIMDNKFMYTVPQKRELQINCNIAYYVFLVVIIKVIEALFFGILFALGKMPVEIMSYLMITGSVTTIIFSCFTAFLRKKGWLAFVSLLLEVPWFIFTIRNTGLFIQPFAIALVIFLCLSVVAVVLYGIIAIAFYKEPLSSGFEQTA